jgi:Carboxypeptidase regulatory-like domain
MSLRRLCPAVSTCLRVMSCYQGLLCFALLICCCTTNISAQGSNATINGQITDPGGHVVPGSEVQAVNIDTNVVYPSKSNGSGIYVVSGLIPGRYRLMVRKDGFKVINKTDITLHVQDILEQNFVLEVGSVSESVTVEGGGQVINTTDGSVSTVIDRQFVANIPLNGRSFQDLISMTPGVVTQSPQAGYINGVGGDFSVNGQRTESNYYTVDGVASNTNAGTGGGSAQGTGTVAASTALGTTQSLISVDALQEFRVQSSTYSAEYGRSPGGQFSFVTRSGTNAVHGSAFDYLRNNYFDANDWFNDHYGKPTAALRQNDFGGTFGAPLVIPHIYDGRSKTFLFASYEGLRLTRPQAATIQYVPDSCMRQTAAPTLQAVLNAFPIQNGMDYGTCTSTTTNPSLAQFIESYSLPSKVDATSVRIDQSVSSKLVVFFRFGDTPSSASTRSLSAVSKQNVNDQTYTLGATAQLARNVSSEFRLGYSRGNSGVNETLDSFGGAVPTNLASSFGIGNSPSPEPYLLINFAGIGSTSLINEVAQNRTRQWNLTETVVLNKGKNLFKFGIDYLRIKSPFTEASPIVLAEYLNSGSMVSGNAAVLEIGKFVSATPIFNEFAAFANDEFRITPRLSASLGARWEVDPPPTEASGNDAYTLLGNIGNPSSLSLAPRGTPLWKTSYFNFAPRAGLAWTAQQSPGWETVIRTGAGVFFDTDNALALRGYNGLGFSAVKLLFGAPIPVTSSELSFSAAPVAPYTSVYAFPSHLQLPYTLEWNLSLEQALGKTQSVTLSYVGSNGRRQLQLQQLSLSALNPNFGTVFYLPAGETSNYQALQLKYQRAVARGVQGLVSYTWSHSIDFGSANSALPTQRASSDFDVRNNLQAGLNWDLPGLTNNSILSALTTQWAMDARLIVRDAFPITLSGNEVINPATGQTYYGGVNFVPGNPLYLYSSQYAGGRSLNPKAFVANASPTVNGNVPRNFFRGFDESQLNVAVRRGFHLYGRTSLEFRAEAFNILNHPNFGYVDNYLPDATFGQATSMLNQGLQTLSSQYQQGGPRSMQFALKLLF